MLRRKGGRLCAPLSFMKTSFNPPANFKSIKFCRILGQLSFKIVSSLATTYLSHETMFSFSAQAGGRRLALISGIRWALQRTHLPRFGCSSKIIGPLGKFSADAEKLRAGDRGQPTVSCTKRWIFESHFEDVKSGIWQCTSVNGKVCSARGIRISCKFLC